MLKRLLELKEELATMMDVQPIQTIGVVTSNHNKENITVDKECNKQEQVEKTEGY